jgi:hypothetical protein
MFEERLGGNSQPRFARGRRPAGKQQPTSCPDCDKAGDLSLHTNFVSYSLDLVFGTYGPFPSNV